MLLLESIDKENVIAVIPENREVFMSGLAGKELKISFEGIKQIADKLEFEERKVQAKLA